MPNPFLNKQLSLAQVHSLIVKNISISSYSVQLNSSNSNSSVQYKYNFCPHTVFLQTTQFSASTVSMSKTVLVQTIQFSISMQFSFILPIDRTLSGVTTSCHGGPGSDGNEGVLHIPQCSSITGISPSDCLVSYPGHLLQRCCWCILEPQPTVPDLFLGRLMRGFQFAL